ncbi:hypothetical protein M3181_19090 [Mesobacillus maritimus]|uniref:hypothetical protein n=1 Tax=Mesobacillus maritimus TaxID=1643336 RepID=UPI00203EC8DA|nr:hypothetical protein [Mesobacillus maritimus]MCM3671069.1 hypothetical protein [Mesobacillus maritimus]
MLLLLKINEWLNIFWGWFWYFRRGKVRYRVFYFGDTYMACASNGKVSVWSCYGNTPEAAKEMAQFQLRRAYEENDKHMNME